MVATAYKALAPTLTAQPRSINVTGGTAGSNVIGTFIPVRVGDYCVVFILGNVSSVDLDGTAFTQVFSGNSYSLWVMRNTGSTDMPGNALNANLTTSYALTLGVIYGVKNAASYVAGAGYSASSQADGDTPNLGSLAAYGDNALLVAMYGCSSSGMTGSVTALNASPSSIATYNYNNQVVIGGGGGGGSTTYNFSLSASNGELAPQVTTPGYRTLISGTKTGFGGLLIAFIPATIILDDNTLQIDRGPLLNSPSDIMPLYDVENITGLSDMSVNSSTDAVDGASGAYNSAKFLNGKTIVIEGTIYTVPPFDEAVVDALKTVLNPTGFTKSLVYKPGNKTPRVIKVYSTGITAPQDNNRNVGKTAYQIQLSSDDAFALGIIPKAALLVPNTTVGVVVSGNNEAFPVIFFNLYPTEIATSGALINFTNATWARNLPDFDLYDNTGTVTIDVTTTVPGMYKLDFKNRTLTCLSVTANQVSDYSSSIVNRNWWTLLSQQTNIINVMRSGASGEELVMAFQDTWV